jgi:phosphoserine phosphatase RsbU/P
MTDSTEEAYETAPCGLLSTWMDGTIVKVNSTLLDWIGLPRDAVVGRLRFTDLLTVGGRMYHETHLAPLLRMQGEVDGVALELKQSGGERMPILVSSVVKYDDADRPALIRTTIFDAHIRRAYEQELLRERQAADLARHQAETDRARLQDALASSSNPCFRQPSRSCRGWRPRPTTTPRHPTNSAATSTTSSPSTPNAGVSSSVTSAAKVPPLPP